MHEDPYARELARRLAIAEISFIMRQSFYGFYKRYATDAGEFWVHLTILCLEDKTFGCGFPGSIVCHPVLENFPALRDIRTARRDAILVTVAKRFQAAFGTMNRFHATRPQGGISSFDRLLQRIDEPEDLWIVIAGLSRKLRELCPIWEAASDAIADDAAMKASAT